jgi:hypothetical protein
MDAGAFPLSLVGLEQILKSRNDANKATSQRHSSYRSGDRLYQNIFYGRKGIRQRPRDSLEPCETQQSARHGHTRDPSGLQAKVRVGEADDSADSQSEEQRAEGEILRLLSTRREDRSSVRVAVHVVANVGRAPVGRHAVFMAVLRGRSGGR